ncbi:MAG: hypothetical protein PUP90_23350 [Nostoc sp. S4]|nr:hypothetical protein [Nostoc sp. S4]
MARRYGDHGDDPHRHSGTARRQDRGLDGKGQRRAVPDIKHKQLGASVHVQGVTMQQPKIGNSNRYLQRR